MLALYVHALALTSRFRQDLKAVTAIEYGLIAALIAVVIITSVSLVGTDLTGVFNGIAAKLLAATPT